MNYKMIFHTMGQTLKILGVLLAVPLLVSIIYWEKCVWAFLITMAICFGAGFTLTALLKPTSQVFYSREGFIIVALAWVVFSAVGALPFVISGDIPNYIDAFFETVSGFSTTGSSILVDVEKLSRGCLFWRSFTHWIGGMGILVFVMAITAKTPDRSIHILRAEMPGPVVDKLVPRSKDTAKILYLIYIVMTAVLVIMLWAGGMPFYDSLLHAFGTAGTGGLAIKNDGLASYGSYAQWVIAVFMFLFGINFNVYFLIIVKKFKAAFTSEELWDYVVIAVACTIAITCNLYQSSVPLCNNLADTFRISAFQVSSIITSTGFTTSNINAWPAFSKSIIFFLMFVGACAGSTGGGLKISRFIILLKTVRKQLRTLLHPRSASIVKFEGKRVDDNTLYGITNYFAVYAGFIIFLFLAVSLFGNLSLEANFSAVVSCFNNMGPAFGEAAANYNCFSYPAKFILSLAMLFGRLEIYPLLLTLLPNTWLRNR